MKRDDILGIGLSLAVHALLLLVFSLMSMAAADPQPLGFIEVDFGPLADGRPVRTAVAKTPAPPTPEPEPEPAPEETPPSPAPEEAKPVDLPDQPVPVESEEEVVTPDADAIAPEKATTPEPVDEPEPEPEPEIKPLGGGTPAEDAGDAEGDEGEGDARTKTAPFQIEGLSRDPISTVLPAYTAQVNAVISVRITVDPSGRIIRRTPFRKGNPDLEKAVLDALQRWRFNPLPANAPQETQTGIITFRFRLE